MESRYFIRPACATDLPLLSRWRAMPHVSRWWGDPTIEPEIEKLREPRIAMWIAEFEGRPFAFIQDYDVRAWSPHHFDYLPPSSRGMDVYIGELAMLGVGHGSRLLRQHVDRLFMAGAPAVGIDPHPRQRHRAPGLRNSGLLGCQRSDRHAVERRYPDGSLRLDPNVRFPPFSEVGKGGLSGAAMSAFGPDADVRFRPLADLWIRCLGSLRAIRSAASSCPPLEPQKQGNDDPLSEAATIRNKVFPEALIVKASRIQAGANPSAKDPKKNFCTSVAGRSGRTVAETAASPSQSANGQDE